MAEKTVRHNGAGGAHGFVPKENWLGRGQRPQAVMIDDFHNLHLVRPLHGLRKFIVIHQDELAVHLLEEVRLRQNPDRVIVVIHHRKRLEVGRRRHRLNARQRFIMAEGQKVLVDHVLHRDRRAAEHRRRRRVMRGEQQRHLLLGREIHHRLGHRQTARDDDHAHLLANRQILNLQPIADHHDQFLLRVIRKALVERLHAHRADHQDEILLAIHVRPEDDLRVQRAGEIAHGREHPARFHETARHRQEELRHLEHRQKPLAHAIVREHRQHADVLVVHHTQGMRHRLLRRHTHDVRRHHVTNFRRDIGDKAGRGDPERLEDEIDSVIRIATANRLRVGSSGPALELRVTDGRTDRVRVRVAVADDQ